MIFLEKLFFLLDLFCNYFHLIISRKKQIFLILPMLLCAFFSIFNFINQMWEIGYTTADDVAVTGILIDEYASIIYDAWINLDQRVVFYLTSALDYVRLSFGSGQIPFRIFTITPVIFLVLSYSWLVKELFQSRYIGFSSFVFCFSFFQHSWFHNSLSSFPLNLNLGFLFLTLSFTLFLKFFKNRLDYTLAASFLGSLSVFIYEMFIPYLVVFGYLFFLMIIRKELSFNKEVCWRFLYFLLPLIFSVAIVSSYHINADFQQGHNNISMVSKFNIWKYIESVWVFTYSSIPGTIFHHYHHFINNFFNVNGDYSIVNVSHLMRISWLIVPSSCCLVVYIFKFLYVKKIFLYSEYFILFLISFSLVFSSNLLVSLTIGHQGRALGGHEIMYAGSYFSMYGWIFILCLVLKIISDLQNIHIKNIFIFISIYLFNILYQNQVSNTFVATHQSLSYSRWKILEKMHNNQKFNHIDKHNSIIFSKGMWGEVGDPFWGVFHPHGWKHRDAYWYNFSLNSFKEGLPIFRNNEGCNHTVGRCDNKDKYVLLFNVDFKSRSSSIRVCEDKIEGLVNCEDEKFRSFL
ncbi:MAG: hypothetical protein AB8C84_00045 [Oligoflexales bacterium]